MQPGQIRDHARTVQPQVWTLHQVLDDERTEQILLYRRPATLGAAGLRVRQQLFDRLPLDLHLIGRRLLDALENREASKAGRHEDPLAYLAQSRLECGLATLLDGQPDTLKHHATRLAPIMTAMSLHSCALI